MTEQPANIEDAPEEPARAVWHWAAVALLVICWIAEAAMCADRGL